MASDPLVPEPAGTVAAEPVVAPAWHETIEHYEPLVHHWRASQLRRLGIPAPLAEVYAGRIDWHQIARLVKRGCPPRLALRIVS